MTDTPPPQAPKGTPLWIRIALVVSLAVNLLIAGIVIGASVTRDRGANPVRAEIAAARDLGPLPFVVALEREDRRALARALRGEAASLRQNREELRVRFESLLTALRAEPFDAETVRGLMREQREIAVRRQEIGERILLERLGEMTPAERNAYADRLDRSLRRGASR